PMRCGSASPRPPRSASRRAWHASREPSTAWLRAPPAGADRVIDVTAERVADVYVARQAIERAAAEQVHLRDPRAAGEELMAIVETTAAPDSHADIVFHERLVALADSPRLRRMHNTLLVENRICIR